MLQGGDTSYPLYLSTIDHRQDSALPITMKIVPIPPTDLIADAAVHHEMHFCLTHVCTHDEEYAKQYKSLGHSPATYLMMDNGAFENGGSDVLGDVMRWTEFLWPDEVILPDRMFMTDETIKRSKEGIIAFRQKYGDDLRHYGKRLRLQGVIHGRNHKELLDCAYAMFDMGVDVIGIPKDYEAFSGGREVILAMIEKIGLPVHLLGMEKDYWDYTKWRNTELVRSMDTAKPYILAWHGHSMFDDANIAYRRPRPDGYFNIKKEEMDMDLVRHNLCEWHKAYN